MEVLNTIVIVQLHAEIAIEVERGVYDRPVGQLKISRRVDALPVAGKLRLAHPHGKMIGNFVQDHRIANDVRKFSVVKIHIAPAEGELDHIIESFAVQESIETKAQPSYARLHLADIEIAFAHAFQRQAVLHPEANVEPKQTVRRSYTQAVSVREIRYRRGLILCAVVKTETNQE